jgi:hypothetical protein
VYRGHAEWESQYEMSFQCTIHMHLPPPPPTWLALRAVVKRMGCHQKSMPILSHG